MNADLMRKALEKVVNPHVLVNYVSRRVRQLNSGGGGFARPLVEVTSTDGAADVALKELIEEKIGFELMINTPPVAGTPKRRRRSG